MVKSENSFYRIINSSEAEYEKICNSIDSFYYKKKEPKTDQFGITKYDNSGNIIFRTLYPPKGRLKVIQGLIAKRILSQISLPKELHGSIKKKSGITNAKAHKGNRFFFQTDLKSYFPSITNKIVNDEFLKIGFSNRVAHLITRLVTYNFQLPQGSPSSPMISNIVFLPQDQRIIKLAKDYNLTYTRYIDDLTFSSSKYIEDSIIQAVLDIIRESPFSYHHKKTNANTGSIITTGAKVKPHKVAPTDAHIMKYALYESDHPSAKGLEAFFQQLEKV